MLGIQVLLPAFKKMLVVLPYRKCKSRYKNIFIEINIIKQPQIKT